MREQELTIIHADPQGIVGSPEAQLLVKNVKALNFQSHAGFDVDLPPGPVCVVGANMSGKSSFGRALVWAFAGRFPYHADAGRFRKGWVRPSEKLKLHAGMSEKSRAAAIRRYAQKAAAAKSSSSKNPTVVQVRFTVPDMVSGDSVTLQSGVDVQSPAEIKEVEWIVTRIETGAKSFLSLESPEKKAFFHGPPAQELLLSLNKIPPAGTLNDRIDMLLRGMWLGVGQSTSFFFSTGIQRREILEASNPFTKLSLMKEEADRMGKDYQKQIDDMSDRKLTERARIEERMEQIIARARDLVECHSTGDVDECFLEARNLLEGAGVTPETIRQLSAAVSDAKARLTDLELAKARQKELQAAIARKQEIAEMLEKIDVTECQKERDLVVREQKNLDDLLTRFKQVESDLKQKQTEQMHEMERLMTSEGVVRQLEGDRSTLDQIMDFCHMVIKEVGPCHDVESRIESTEALVTFCSGFAEEIRLDPGRYLAEARRRRDEVCDRADECRTRIQDQDALCTQKKDEARVYSELSECMPDLSVVRDSLGKLTAQPIPPPKKVDEPLLSRVDLLSRVKNLTRLSPSLVRIVQLDHEIASLAPGPGSEHCSALVASLEAEQDRILTEINAVSVAEGDIGAKIERQETVLTHLSEHGEMSRCDMCGGEMDADRIQKSREMAEVTRANLLDKRSKHVVKKASLQAELQKMARDLDGARKASREADQQRKTVERLTKDRNDIAQGLDIYALADEVASVMSAADIYIKSRPADLQKDIETATAELNRLREELQHLVSEIAVKDQAISALNDEFCEITSYCATVMLRTGLDLSGALSSELSDKIDAAKKAESEQRATVNQVAEAVKKNQDLCASTRALINDHLAPGSEDLTNQEILTEAADVTREYSVLVAEIEQKLREVKALEGEVIGLSKLLSSSADRPSVEYTPELLEKAEKELLRLTEDLDRARGVATTLAEARVIDARIQASDKLATDLALAKEDSEAVSVCRRLLAPNGDARTLALAGDISSIVQTTNKNLSDIETRDTLAVDLVLEKGEDAKPTLEMKFEVNGPSASGTELPSKSQRHIIGLVTDLSLRSHASRVGFLVIDEPEEGLDEVNKIKLTSWLAKQSTQVIILTNNASAGFDQIVSTTEIRESAGGLSLVDFNLNADALIDEGLRSILSPSSKD